jgi:protein phosphatase
MPQKMAELLAIGENRLGVLTNNEASDVLRTAFRNTEAALDFPYEVFTPLWLILESSVHIACYTLALTFS